MKQSHLDLLNKIQEKGEELPQPERYMLIDGLNLFFRNFSAIRAVNPDGAHIGGLGGFFRSLGSLIRQIQPTQVYMVFDGIGSSTNRKNIIPEYKSNRNIKRITNWDAFDNLEEEDQSKIDQITRIVQYLKTLPIKTITLGKVEADDVIAYLSKTLPKGPDDRSFIVSSDKDYLQLIDNNTVVYRPMEKEYYTEQTVKDKFNISPHNFLLYKLLMGDSSDGINGIKGLGPKGLYKRFPELTERDMSLDDLLDVAESKLGEHITYARVLHDIELLENKYKVMDLANPMIDDKDKMFIDKFVENTPLNYLPSQFIEMYNQDQLGGLIRNVDIWLKDIFEDLLENQ
tara:strand:+ start:2642 stop:3670 length:1029 start_codon:yes stop_codon:yes gene_type:complete